jgi:anti-anti-sigma factor
MSDATPDLAVVRLVGFPVPVQQRAAARYDALMREFALLRSEQPSDSVPNRLLELVDDLTSRFGGFTGLPTSDIEAARERGDATVDVEYRIPPAAADAARAFNDLLDETDDYCRAGRHLVTLAEAPDVLAFRRWFLSEFTNQIAGAAPVPFADFFALDDPDDPDDPDGPEEAPASSAPGTPAAAGGNGSEAATPDGDGQAVVVFEGELDMATAETLRRQVNELRDSGARTIVIDARGITFIDSVGLSIVIALHLRLSESGAVLVLRSPSRAVFRMLDIAGLSGHLVVEPPA